ncbi:MAG: hypothetical protein LH619_09750 [Chitinophagaceae bacterium]|nr:hypothetical protein [Chitinophagaceae bacterium]
MQSPSNLKTFLTASLALCIISCNNSKKEKDEKEKPADTTVATTTPPPADNPPDTAMQSAEQKCYRNDGLKYSTVITINYSAGADVTGSIVNQDLETDKKEAAKFTGTVTGDKLTVKFVGKPPVMGAASEWTDKPWTINKSGKEKLIIVFNAKNYDTNKWAHTDYEFELSGCK